MTGVILSGGENTRMPYLKGFLKVEGRTLIERNLDVLGRVFGRVVISTNAPEQYFYFGVPLIGDIKKEKGPVTGIVSVLSATGGDDIFVVACDMPFISERLIRHMVDSFNGGTPAENSWRRTRGSEIKKPDAVIPVFRGRTEPLCGIYNGDILGKMETFADNGHRSLNGMLKMLNVLYITEEDIRAIDPEGRSFLNINTIEDYEKIGGVPCLV